MNDVFRILDLAPTRDLASIKRAYFRLLSTNSPQTNPEGFKKLRAAYESLLQPEGMLRAFASAPVDIAALDQELGATWDGRVTDAAADASRRDDPTIDMTRLIALLSTRRWSEVSSLERQAQRSGAA